MTTLAIIIDDTHFASERWTLFPLCAFLPSLVILFSWMLIRWEKRFVVVALLVAGIAAWLILSRMNENLRRWEVRRAARPDTIVVDASFEETAASWFAAEFPFAMIALFYFTVRRPNKSLQPTPMADL
jgi:hypothetical protein